MAIENLGGFTSYAYFTWFSIFQTIRKTHRLTIQTFIQIYYTFLAWEVASPWKKLYLPLSTTEAGFC